MQGSSTFLHITWLTRGAPITPSESLQTDHPHRVCSKTQVIETKVMKPGERSAPASVHPSEHRARSEVRGRAQAACTWIIHSGFLLPASKISANRDCVHRAPRLLDKRGRTKHDPQYDMPAPQIAAYAPPSPYGALQSPYGVRRPQAPRLSKAGLPFNRALL
ncbi:hypothetical protein VTN00DRAFT_1575 [Thermoascus crustaceus]|uniref:uncharacterized protein n=1 Tax=Thermoascus crustaceus TaxID=5088 RepID=UPI0037440C57